MPTLAERFAAKVEDRDGHRLWTGAVNARGQGQMRVDGRLTTARRVAWELGRGALATDTGVTSTCGVERCVSVDHLALRSSARSAGPQWRRVGGEPTGRRRGKGGGSMRERSPGHWELTVTVGRSEDGKARRATRTFTGSAASATRALATFVAEVQERGMPEPVRRDGATVDDLVVAYWPYAAEQGRAHSTLAGYRTIYANWLKPEIGQIAAAALSARDLDRAFGAMRAAGLSHSQMNQAKVILSNAYKLGRRYGTVGQRDPLTGFELPTSTRVRREVRAPELDELLSVISKAEEVCPEIVPLLKFGAVTGCRRGELCGLRWSRVNLAAKEVTIDHVVNDAGGTLVCIDLTKTGKARTMAIDDLTAEMLTELRAQCDADRELVGVGRDVDLYVFAGPGSVGEPMRPELLTRRMRRVRKAMGAEGGSFDTTILALRKFTTTELLDAGFNPSMVSSRQGHTTQTMLKHYGKRRRSADVAAATHLGGRVLSSSRKSARLADGSRATSDGTMRIPSADPTSTATSSATGDSHRHRPGG